jgi:hypothetical protein
MDGQRFDAIVRASAAGGTSRRHILKGLAGGLLGGMVGLRARGEVAAARTHVCCHYSCPNPPTADVFAKCQGPQDTACPFIEDCSVTLVNFVRNCKPCV